MVSNAGARGRKPDSDGIAIKEAAFQCP